MRDAASASIAVLESWSNENGIERGVTFALGRVRRPQAVARRLERRVRPYFGLLTATIHGRSDVRRTHSGTRGWLRTH